MRRNGLVIQHNQRRVVRRQIRKVDISRAQAILVQQLDCFVQRVPGRLVCVKQIAPKQKEVSLPITPSRLSDMHFACCLQYVLERLKRIVPDDGIGFSTPHAAWIRSPISQMVVGRDENTERARTVGVHQKSDGMGGNLRNKQQLKKTKLPRTLQQVGLHRATQTRRLFHTL